LVSLAPVALLAGADRWRFDTMAGATEGWLNLLAPLAWACLIALAVLEEPLAGDRHFWLTRPHRWPALLGAKAVFAALFVHLPCLVADAYILAAHGFSPFAFLPQLLWKQLALAAFLTLPALALSALIRSFTHFMMGVFAVATAAVFTFTTGASRGSYIMMRQDDYTRGEVVAFLIGAGALAIVWLQYRRRPAIFARGVGIATVLLAGALIAVVPWTADSHARAMRHPAKAPVTLRFAPRTQSPENHYFTSGRANFTVPMALSGLPTGAYYRVGLLSLTLTGSDGRRYQGTAYRPGTWTEKVPLDGNLYPNPPDPSPDLNDTAPPPLWLSLRLDPAIYASLKDGSVRFTGQTVVSVVRLGETAWMPVGGRVAAPGVGYCSNGIGDNREQDDRINVLCESPSGIPQVVHVTMWSPEDRTRYASPPHLGSFGNYSVGPQMALLSPLDRGKTYFLLSDPKYRKHATSYAVPMEHLAHARIGVTPEVVTGYSVTNFDISNVPLSKYWEEPRTY
jgi:hypothetical protein